VTPNTPFTISLDPVEPEHAGRCPLAAVDIAVRVTGLVVESVYALRFINTADVALAAMLRLPLPDDAVVREVELRQGATTLRAAVRDVEAARREYNEALAQGRRAALAEEVRPNLLLLRVSALAPAVPVEIRARVASPLAFDAGEGTIVIPVTMTPRYCPPGMNAEDARKVSPPFVRGERLYGLSFTLDLEAGAPLLDVRSPSHSLRVERSAETRATVTLREGEVLPDRDLVVHFRVDTSLERPTVATARTREGDTATVMLSLPPPGAAHEGRIIPRHVTFLLDRSGSMWGEPIEAAKRALRALMRGFGPEDVMRVIAFDDQLIELPSMSVGDMGFSFYDKQLSWIHARGGTEILPAFERAVVLHEFDTMVQVVVLLTDGAVGNEREIIDRVAEACSTHGLRAHAVGVGSAVNRDFIRGFARAGRGLAEFIPNTADIEPALVQFQARSNAPLATDVSFTIEGLAVSESAPSGVGDVDLGQPVVAFTRVTGSGDATAVLRARTRDGAFERRIPLRVPEGVHGNPAIESLWARARVNELLLDDPAGSDAVRALGLAHGIVTPRTALVAVERNDPGTGEAPREVEVPLHMPAGVMMGLETEVVAAGGAACAAASPCEPTCYDVLLEDAGHDRVATMRALRAVTGWPIAQVKKAVDNVPVRVREEMMFAEAREIVDALSRAGARARAVTTSWGASPDSYRLPPRTDAQRVGAALRFLARSQSADGSFGDGPTTRRVLDAFAAAGETSARGPWRRPLARAEAFWQSVGSPAAPTETLPHEKLVTAQTHGGADDGGVFGLGDTRDATAQLVLALAV
jgi:Ca-activated chloride channel family protein